ncbi:MAG: cell envelope integrity protein TolA [Alphaproteobacteria bacterium]|nr:cell envelope integrity protein TolA [Alphaproteobacteria bacterium]
MRFGVFSSFLIHLAIVGLVLVSPPSWRSAIVPEPYIPIELIREAELDLVTSVPAARPEPEPIEEIEEPDLPEPVIEKEPEPEPVEPEPAPEPIQEAPTPKPPAPKPEPKKPELDLDALSKLIDLEKDTERVEAPREVPSETTETADQTRAAIGPGDRLTATDEVKMRAAVQRCWNAGTIIGAPEPEKLIVKIDFELTRDGVLASAPRVANALQINLSGNRFWKVAEREAISAVVKCAPYDFLSPDRYETWKEFSLTFDPSQMVGR